MSLELNNAVFVGRRDARNWQKAYYYGPKIVNSLVESGYSLAAFTLMHAEDMVAILDDLSSFS